jgi:hypothetical protein
MNVNGLGNALNEGWRTMETVGDDYLFVGSATFGNLHPDGGWEVIQIEKEK